MFASSDIQPILRQTDAAPPPPPTPAAPPPLVICPSQVDSISIQLEKNQQCACKDCGKLFNSVWYLKQHAVKHSNDRPFKCKFCHKTYKFRSNLYQHKCPDRIKATNTKRSAAQRPLGVLQQLGQLPPGNRQSPFSTSSASSTPSLAPTQLITAMDTAARRKPQPPPPEKRAAPPPLPPPPTQPALSQQFIDTYLHVHRQKLHQCRKCKLIFPSREYLSRHMAAHTYNEQFVYRCQQCPQVFDNERDLGRHRSLHCSISPHCCANCSAIFRSVLALRRHLDQNRVCFYAFQPEEMQPPASEPLDQFSFIDARENLSAVIDSLIDDDHPLHHPDSGLGSSSDSNHSYATSPTQSEETSPPDPSNKDNEKEDERKKERRKSFDCDGRALSPASSAFSSSGGSPPRKYSAGGLYTSAIATTYGMGYDSPQPSGSMSGGVGECRIGSGTVDHRPTTTARGVSAALDLDTSQQSLYGDDLWDLESSCSCVDHFSSPAPGPLLSFVPRRCALRVEPLSRKSLPDTAVLAFADDSGLFRRASTINRLISTPRKPQSKHCENGFSIADSGAVVRAVAALNRVLRLVNWRFHPAKRGRVHNRASSAMEGVQERVNPLASARSGDRCERRAIARRGRPSQSSTIDAHSDASRPPPEVTMVDASFDPLDPGSSLQDPVHEVSDARCVQFVDKKIVRRRDSGSRHEYQPDLLAVLDLQTDQGGVRGGDSTPSGVPGAGSSLANTRFSLIPMKALKRLADESASSSTNECSDDRVETPSTKRASREDGRLWKQGAMMAMGDRGQCTGDVSLLLAKDSMIGYCGSRDDWQCPKCPKRFATRRLMRQHLAFHARYNRTTLSQ